MCVCVCVRVCATRTSVRVRVYVPSNGVTICELYNGALLNQCVSQRLSDCLVTGPVSATGTKGYPARGTRLHKGGFTLSTPSSALTRFHTPLKCV